jgi:hypothetical protein
MVFSQFANSKLKAGDVLEVEHQKEVYVRSRCIQITPLYLEAESLLFVNSKVGFEKRT